MTPEIVEFPFAKFIVHEHFIVGEPAYGVNMGLEELRVAGAQLIPRFEGRPWGYIGNRVNFNSVDPTVYANLKAQAPNFTAMAIVAHAPSTARVAALESVLIRSADLEFGLFDDLEHAQEWMLKVLGTSRLDSSRHPHRS
ncbi:hypothetical protein [Coraliomargarita akajimensis]|uniref:STAS/SEC14 domain-containing protein n=1 Tax=Coraliomargarita akajimensis (strain DSM 45221 / IAM 15411 / JCM 23193 / KCTC 12865 / 04OKA010-24) TaxID=583355 RepID=D5EHK5_CORAD|nr:hypothetical protein [Coraliomargarita akajimensis]ADE54046.1 hypothetical protein Caka_1024 [Coraliomargarita akajimensis DSM 45221]